jgi:hypothetical protein
MKPSVLFSHSSPGLCAFLRVIPALLLAFAFPLSAQEADGIIPDGTAIITTTEEAAGPDAADEAEAAEEIVETDETDETEAAEEVSPEARIMELDISTSTLNELASWCRTLGLSEGGSREDLANRLRGYYSLKPPAPAAGGETASSNKKFIIIESARSTEYFTLEAVDEEYARLRGDVVVTLREGEALHRIQAWEILYNRTRNILSASGGVEYIKEDGDTRETYRGESITVNLDDWASVFMDSVSERSISNDETVYRFAGTLITRSDEEVTILTDAEITNGGNDESFWSLKASKLWLLPGSDWAVLNAILKVGHVPVLYIPFFFYPANEIIFHPVLGSRSREGNFVQTTTYILGRPQVSETSQSSISRILGNSADNEKVREGIFLRSTNKKAVAPNDTRVSLLFDWYANMGGYLGTEVALPRREIFGAQTISAGLGFTRNIYELGRGSYSPFTAYLGSSEWNKSRIFSAEVPFRYRMEAKGSLSGVYGSMNWSLPFYSDRYVNRDFLNRSEEMDWFRMLMDGPEKSEDYYTSNVLSSYNLQLSGSLTPKVTVLNPYLTNLSISNMSSALSFGNRPVIFPNTANRPHLAPDDAFFFPDKFTILSVSASIQGDPLRIPAASQARSGRSSPANQGQAEAPEDPFKNIGVPRSPWAVPDTSETFGMGGPPYDLKPPVLSQSFDLPRIGSPRFTVSYRFSPSGASELQFRSNTTNWPAAEDVNWNELSSVLTSLRTDGSVTFSLTDANTGVYTSSIRLFGNAAWQGYSLMNEEADEFDTRAIIDAAERRVNAATLFSTSAENITTIKPLYRSAVWGNTNLQYTLRGLIAKSVFNNSTTEPEWDIEWGEWTREKLDAHQVQANINASVMDKVQTLSLTSELPPKQNTLTGNATFRAWISETTASQKVIDPFEESRKFEPFSFSELLKFGTSHSIQQRITYDPEIEEFTGLTSTLTLGGFGTIFNASYARTWDLVAGQGWIQSPAGTEKLEPRDLQFTYAKTATREGLWDGNVSFSLTTNSKLLFDLQRYSYSKLDFSLGFKIGISKLLDFSFTATSENAVVMRYFQDFPFVNLPGEIQGEKNLLFDLANSFRFDNERLRRESGFKMKSFTFSLIHYLGDWTAKLNWTVSPYRPEGWTTYKFNNEISFLVQWTPISEVKTDIYYNKDVLEIR